jgi:hypothetical protein
MSIIGEICSGFRINYELKVATGPDFCKPHNVYHVASSVILNDSKDLLFASCFLGLYFDVEDGGGMFIRNVGNFYHITRHHISKYNVHQH